MKKLILVRHGKSSWEYSVNDKDRPLKERGINDGHLVANAFKQKDVAIDAIFASPANRALHTCMIFLRQLHFPFSQFEITNELYDFSGDYILQFVKNLDNSFETVMIFGHNHAFTHLANALGSIYIENVPTSGLVHLTFDTNNWSSIEKGATNYTIFPKHLK
ncbi:MAG: histidine phosphatase family protein [Maribacter sp.]|nr:histidine phosphatase family protein [Maribacter sp.]